MYVMYTAEDKAQAIKMRDAGKTVSMISKELNIAESTLYRWFCIYATTQSINEELTAKEVARLTAECQHLQHIVEIVHQSGCIKEIPLQATVQYPLLLFTFLAFF